MIFEHRCYTLKWGAAQAFWDAQVVRGFEPMQPVLDRLVSYFSCRAGPSDQLIHLYRYDSYDDWQARVHGLQGAAGLQSYFKTVRPLMIAQENRFLALAPLAQLNPLWGAGCDGLPPTGTRPPADLHLRRTALVEESVLQLVPGALPALWEHYGQCDLQRGSAVTDNLVACFSTLVGRFHQVVHYRSYPDLLARQRHQSRLQNDASWQRLVEAMRPLTLACENKLLQPAALPQLSPLFSD